MHITHSIEETRARLAELSGTIAFVPTMGALHAGHRALVEAAKQQADHVVASLFINPKQFGANEDLSRYPRTFDQDVTLLKEAGVTLLFAPSEAELYPKGFVTSVTVHAMGDILCGAHRPGHFDGVTTVVALLFSIIRPHVAVFGEKDYQQLAIIRRMNQDLHLVDRIIGVPTVREIDGLALSSRNRYLTGEERGIAPLLHQTLCDLNVALQQNPGTSINELTAQATRHLLTSGFSDVQYLEMRNADTLALTSSPKNARLFAAAILGNTRLIDNIPTDVS